MINDCENLDAFLADDLPSPAAVRFEAHLIECAACRDAIERQRWIDGLLRSPLRLELEAAPAGVADAVRATIVRRRQRARLAAGALAAAAAMVVAVGWTLIALRQAEHSTIAVADADNEPSPKPSLERRGSDVPRAVFIGGPDVIVMPVKTSHPNVTVVRIYPTYEPSYSVQASVETPTADSDLASPHDLNFNGGSL